MKRHRLFSRKISPERVTKHCTIYSIWQCCSCTVFAVCWACLFVCLFAWSLVVCLPLCLQVQTHYHKCIAIPWKHSFWWPGTVKEFVLYGHMLYVLLCWGSSESLHLLLTTKLTCTFFCVIYMSMWCISAACSACIQQIKAGCLWVVTQFVYMYVYSMIYLFMYMYMYVYRCVGVGVCDCLSLVCSCVGCEWVLAQTCHKHSGVVCYTNTTLLDCLHSAAGESCDSSVNTCSHGCISLLCPQLLLVVMYCYHYLY